MVIITWVRTTFAADSGKLLEVINHGTSEEFGMNEFSHQLNKSFNNIEVLHFKQGYTLNGLLLFNEAKPTPIYLFRFFCFCRSFVRENLSLKLRLAEPFLFFW